MTDSLSDQMGAASKSAITDEDMAFLAGMAGYGADVVIHSKAQRSMIALWLIGRGYFGQNPEYVLSGNLEFCAKVVNDFENEIMRIEPSDDERRAACRFTCHDNRGFAWFVHNLNVSSPRINKDAFAAKISDVEQVCGFVIKYARAEKLLDIFAKIRKDLGMLERTITIPTQNQALQRLFSPQGLEEAPWTEQALRDAGVVVLNDRRELK